MNYFFLSLLIVVAIPVHSQDFQLKKIETNVTCSFRGLSVIDTTVAWISGSKGCVGITVDGGNTWHFTQVKGFEEDDFRSLYAFDSLHAIIANTGFPAHVLVTADGGKNWKQAYTNNHLATFFDGVDFWNAKEGLLYGDPIDGKMLILYTCDAGLSWAEIKDAPRLEKGEASFAASGTGIRCINNKEAIISTGGMVSRLWSSTNKGKHWQPLDVPVVHGESTTGIFSVVKNNNSWIVVGGDYKKEDLNSGNNFYSLDKGQTWLTPKIPTRGYRECVEAVTKNILFAIGPSGVDISYDNGLNWKAHSDEKGLHVMRKARVGLLIVAAGGMGKIYLLK